MRLLLVLVLSVCTLPLFSQGVIRGSVKDTADKRNLQHTVVSLLRPQDSVLLQFTRTQANGQFELPNVPAGRYLLMMSYPKFVDYTDTFSIASGQTHDMGTLAMTPRARMLEMATVRQKIAAIRWKGDTLVFKADSFKVKDDATVEDLLKKFPGFQVDRNGQITAMGEKIEKVLVDGEEFFGDDPTIATRNLDARAVNEVEMFDKKSDQAAFTGIDDGQKTKTLNLKLKEDRKKGYFGKAEVASNGKQQWDNSVMVNNFIGKRKISGYGIMSRTGKTGLGWEEAMNYGSMSGMQMGMSDDGGMFMSIEGDDFDGGDMGGGGNGQGIPKSWAGGINYSNKWNGDKLSINGSYRFNKTSTPANNTSRIQYLLPDTTYFINSTSRSFNRNTGQKVSTNSEMKIDSFTTLKLNFAASISDFLKEQVTGKESLTEEQQYVNRNQRRLDDDGHSTGLNAGALLMHRFRKPRRTISLNLTLANQEQKSEGFLYSLTDFYDGNGVITRRDTLDQKRVNGKDNGSFTSNLSYTEPLGKNSQVQVNYGFSTGNSSSLRQSFDKVAGKYESLNALNSADFDFKSRNHTTGIFYSTKNKKSYYNVGNNFIFSTQERSDRLTGSYRRYSFLNLNPNLNLGYNFSKQSRLNLFYSGNTSQPTPEQLNPAQDNTDPLYVLIGNEALKPSFRNNLSMYYNHFNPQTEKYTNVSVSYNSTLNSILAKEEFDAQGRRISQYVNIKDGNSGISFNLAHSAKFRKTSPWRYRLEGSVRNSKNTNFINGLRNTANTNQYSFNPGIGFDKDDFPWSFDAYSRFTYNQNRSGIGANIPNYWTYNISADTDIDLPYKFKLSSTFNYNYRQKTSVNDNTNTVAYWNAYLSRKLGKKRVYKVTLSVNDILNQNVGFSRTVTANGIHENTYDTFRRYWMLRFTWNFARNGKAVSWDDDDE